MNLNHSIPTSDKNVSAKCLKLEVPEQPSTTKYNLVSSAFATIASKTQKIATALGMRLIGVITGLDLHFSFSVCECLDVVYLYFRKSNLI